MRVVAELLRYLAVVIGNRDDGNALQSAHLSQSHDFARSEERKDVLDHLCRQVHWNGVHDYDSLESINKVVKVVWTHKFNEMPLTSTLCLPRSTNNLREVGRQIDWQPETWSGKSRRFNI